MNADMKSFLGSLTTVSDARFGRSSTWDQSGKNKDYWYALTDRNTKGVQQTNSFVF